MQSQIKPPKRTKSIHGCEGGELIMHVVYFTHRFDFAKTRNRERDRPDQIRSSDSAVAAFHI
jgi:hypothetical protein